MRLFACHIPTNEKEAQHRTAYALLRFAVQEVYQIPLPKIAQTEHGKPYFPTAPEISFNLSHCNSLVACVLGTGELGVDVEEIRTRRSGVMRRAFSAEEIVAVEQSNNPDEAFFRYWTLKESYVKAIGIGISYPLRDVRFRITFDQIRASVTGWQFTQFLLGNQWVISCCAPNGEVLPEHVTLRPIK